MDYYIYQKTTTTFHTKDFIYHILVFTKVAVKKKDEERNKKWKQIKQKKNYPKQLKTKKQYKIHCRPETSPRSLLSSETQDKNG